tara:strand:+ start:1301 stop:1729 length:429 start_codon:yes stop_codon:yes gene_type:complete
MIYDNLPDDILDKCYSKIIYKQSINLLSQIRKYGRFKNYISNLYICNIQDLHTITIDLAIVYECIKNNIEPTSCNPEQLDEKSIEPINELEQNLFDIRYHYITDNNYKKKSIINIIKSYIMEIEDYYVYKILNPIIDIDEII